MFTTDIPDLTHMTEQQRAVAVMTWMREITNKTRALEEEVYILRRKTGTETHETMVVRR